MNGTVGAVQSFVQALRRYSASKRSALAFTFLERGEDESARLTFGELDERARAVAAVLQESVEPGARALLVYPPGLDFVVSFFGCLYAGVIAVPTFDPRRVRTTTRLSAIATNAEARVLLTLDSISAGEEGASQARAVVGDDGIVIPTNLIDLARATRWREFEPGPDGLAFLQYTSGSTGQPKGVMVTHGNLLANSEMLRAGFDHSEDTVQVSWLPLFHDMGLISCVLQSVYLGTPAVLMAPADFVQKPIRWLNAMSRYRATTSGAPNSAYEACLRKTTREERESLDLSSLRVLFNGAEPVRPSTMRRFAEAFKVSGLKPEALYPCYGLAEATLFVAGSTVFQEPVTMDVDSLELDEGRARPSSSGPNVRTVASSGRTWLEQRIVIVDPATFVPRPDGLVGEIWISGDNVAQGYWRRPEESEQTFRAQLAGSGEDRFLRTGDLGFLKDGELFVISRLKDLIIIRGRNHYPADIELTVEQCHPAIQPNAIAAFSIEVEDRERLAILCEIKRNAIDGFNADEVFSAVRRAVVGEHEIEVHAVKLLRPSTIPKTSSGKIQRQACKRAFGSPSSLEILGEWMATSSVRATEDQPSAAISPTTRDIQAWLIEKVSLYVSAPAAEIDPRVSFSSLGMDSEKAVRLTGALQDWLGIPLEATLAYDFPTIEALARRLSNELLPVHARHTPAKGVAAGQPIAILGMACNFPGAPGLAQYWTLLRDGVDAVGIVPRSRCSAGSWDGAATGGFVEAVDEFDAEFFGVSPREAEMMDPQQRMLLEVAWQALENAGIAPEQLAGSKTGVFIGISNMDYSKLMIRRPEAADPYFGTGAAHSIAANRISFFLDLRGPSVAVDTACSSSLVALHQACQSLRQGECDVALVGGVNLILAPELTRAFAQAGMMSSTGRCRTFDKQADGYVRGEGCGVVVIKRMGDALRNGDPMLALIKGSALNQDGRTNGLTAPSGSAQEEVIAQALMNAGVRPEEIDYVEAHGTGTQLGDPIEIKSILKTIGTSDRRADLYVGSVKTNIGHLESAAGIAGLIKVVLALAHEEIPPHLHLRDINPLMPLSGTAVRIPSAVIPWPAGPRKRIAGISSFGFGGTNAHVIVEEAVGETGTGRVSEASCPALQSDRPAHLVALSARTYKALVDIGSAFRDRLSSSSDQLSDIAFSANTGRSHFDRRLALVTRSSEEAAEKLEIFLDGGTSRGIFRGDVRPAARPVIAFLFTGQGSQYAGMGRELFESQPSFRRTLEHCDELLRSSLKKPLLEVIYSDSGDAGLIDQTEYTQPALFALEYALAQLWISWGISPAIVMGHSVGEYVAACIAGVFSLEDGLRLIADRARLMQSLPRNGGMAAIHAPVERVRPYLQGHLDELAIAAINSPKQTVISGRLSVLDSVISQIESDGIGFSRLAVSHAFHSPLMQPVLSQFEKTASSVVYRKPAIDLVSNITGNLASGEVARSDYWLNHIMSPVDFAGSMRTIDRNRCDVLIEVGPKPALLANGKECIAPEGKLWLPSLRAKRPAWTTLLESLAEFYTKGGDIDWRGFDRDYSRRRVSIPNYPFQKQRYWIESSNWSGSQDHPLLGRPIEKGANGRDVAVWQVELDDRNRPYLKGHRVFGSSVVPYSVYVELALAAVEEEFGSGSAEITGLQLHQPVRIEPGCSATLQIVLSAEKGDELQFRAYNQTIHPGSGNPQWTLSASAEIQRVKAQLYGVRNEVRSDAVFQQ